MNEENEKRDPELSEAELEKVDGGAMKPGYNFQRPELNELCGLRETSKPADPNERSR